MTDQTAPPPSSQMTPQAAMQRRARRMRQARDAKRVRSLITPEGAALNLRIGSFAERVGAFTIDFIIQWSIVLLVVYGLAFGAWSLGFEAFTIANAFISVIIFLFRNFYFVVFEIGRRAATPGKRLLGLRVASRDGGQLRANAVLARNFSREIEIGLPLSFLFFSDDQLSVWIGLFGFLWAGVFMFFPLFNKDRMRIGDLIAGTWVIQAPKVKLAGDISASGTATPAQALFAFTPAQTDAYGIHELHVLEQVLRNSNDETKNDVALRIRRKIGWTAHPGEQDLDFLEAYYAALRRRLEQRMLFGDRKEDKFDRR